MTCPNCGEVKEVGVCEIRCYDAIATEDGRIIKQETEYPGDCWMEIHCSKCGEVLEERDIP